jgi:hypothetical protein
VEIMRSRSVVTGFACAALLVLASSSGCSSDDEREVPKGGAGGSSGRGGGGSGATGGSSGRGAGGSNGSGGGGAITGAGGTNGSGGTSGTGGTNGTGGTSGAGGTNGTGGTSGAGGQDAGADADAAPDVITDAAPDSSTCTIGEASSEATANDLSLFGTPVYFNGGNPLPAGTYRMTYVDGCMKYGGGQGWTVNAYGETGCCKWWLIGESTADRKLVPPGTIGYAAGSGAFASFADCENESRATAPLEFVHSGGRLGIWLQDSPYTDNLAGEDGRNPRWRLVRLGECVDGGTSDAAIE